MPGWDGNGNFTRVYSWVADKAAGLNIIASRMDTDTDNITNNGFGNTLTRDGQGSATANQPMNGFRHTGVGAALASDQYAVVAGIQNNTYLFAIGAGTADVITATFAPALTAVVDGMQVCVRATAANATSVPTLSPNGLTARAITKNGNQALAIGDIAGAGFEMLLRYVASGTHWELLNPSSAGSIPWIVAGGTANAITAAYVPAITALSDGLLLAFRASAANTTTTPTFAPNALTAHTITRFGGSALNVGDIPAALAECFIRYNLANTRWELMNPATSGATSSGVAGAAVNASMTVAAASATATFTADEVIVQTSLGGQGFKLSSYSQACNLATTGAGGMDTGTAPVSGYVALYAIYNPATNTKSILACSSATSTATIYAGANMPAGYTASALISTWPTDGSSRFVIGAQRSRWIAAPAATIAFASGGVGQTINLATAIPPNAKTFDVLVQGPSGGSISLSLSTGYYVGAKNPGTATDVATVPISGVPVLVAQQVIVTDLATAGAGDLKVMGYTI